MYVCALRFTFVTMWCVNPPHLTSLLSLLFLSFSPDCVVDEVQPHLPLLPPPQDDSPLLLLHPLLHRAPPLHVCARGGPPPVGGLLHPRHHVHHERAAISTV